LHIEPSSTISIEDPPGFIVRTEVRKAAFDNGFRLDRGLESGWMRFGSTTSRGDIWMSGTSPTGPWLLSLERSAVVSEIGIAAHAHTMGPGYATFIFQDLDSLYSTLSRVYQLAVSLPDAPLQQFSAETQSLPRGTEVERFAIERVGQAVFREALLKYWDGRCPLTGIADLQLLRASHIVPWAECETDALRLDVHNGLLLSALWDAVFDSGLSSFADDGTILVSKALSSGAVEALGIQTTRRLLGLTDSHRLNMARHRAKHGFPSKY
jgi:hypothetical protein